MTDRFYGIFDPLNQSTQYIAPCAQCTSTISARVQCYFERPKPRQLPGLVNKETAQINKKSYFIRCVDCGSVGLACKKNWQAVIEWNKSPLSQKFPYQQFPIFGLNKLTKIQAKQRLVDIRQDLELRKKQKIAQNDRLYNNNYERIKAFLAWTIYAQTIIKLSPDIAEQLKHDL